MKLSDCQDKAIAIAIAVFGCIQPTLTTYHLLTLMFSQSSDCFPKCLFTIFDKVSPFNKLPCLISHCGVQHIEIYLNNHLNLELCCLLQPCLKYIVLILIISD